MAAAASGDCPASSSHRGVITFPGEMLQEGNTFKSGPGSAPGFGFSSDSGSGSSSGPGSADSPVHSDLVGTLVHRHRFCHGYYRPLVDDVSRYSRSESNRNIESVFSDKHSADVFN